MRDSPKYIELEDLVDCIVDNRGKTVPTVSEGIPLIATNCIKHSSIYPTFENIRYINQETYHNWFRAHLEPYDILFVNKGTPGRSCIVPNPINFVAAQDMVGLRFRKEFNPFYMLAVLRSTEIQNTIKNNYVGLVIPHFRKQELVKLKLPILEKNTRDNIGHLYYVLSQKIELNNQINAELEAMAKTLYDYWFVQFDFPVDLAQSLFDSAQGPAPQNGTVARQPLPVAERSRTVAERSRGYKSSGGKMVYNEVLKREIPEGWEVNKLQELGNFKNGVNYDPSKPGNIACPIINVRNISKSSFFIKNEDLDVIYLESSDVRKYSVNNDSIIIARSGIPGATRMISDCAPNTLYCGFAIHFNIIETEFKNFIFFYLKSLEEQIKNGSGGTILKNVNQGVLNDLRTSMPPLDVIQQFNKIINPILDKITNLEKQNQELAQLRDWLLPMLMNGQITVGDVEEMDMVAEEKAKYQKT